MEEAYEQGAARTLLVRGDLARDEDGVPGDPPLLQCGSNVGLVLVDRGGIDVGDAAVLDRVTDSRLGVASLGPACMHAQCGPQDRYPSQATFCQSSAIRYMMVLEKTMLHRLYQAKGRREEPR